MEEKLYKFNESDRTIYFATKNGKIITQKKKDGSYKEVGKCIKKTCKWDKQGYKVFSIKNKQYHVHRVVADLFVKKPSLDKCLEVNHIDGNKHNNHFKNLEWVTRSQNVRHAHENNLIKKSRLIRDKNPNYNNFSDPIEKIASGLWYLSLGHSASDAARFCGVPYKRFHKYSRMKLEERYAP